MIEQFSEFRNNHTAQFSYNDLNDFFWCCLNHYTVVEKIINASIDAVKILIRMLSVLPINLENITGKSAAARIMVSNIRRNVLNKNLFFWEVVLNHEWPSLRQGLVTSLCLGLYFSERAEHTDQCSIVLKEITDQTKRTEAVTQLLDLLKRVKCLPKREEMLKLFGLIESKSLTLEPLENSGYLEIYIHHLTQIILSTENGNDQWEEKVRMQLKKFPRNKLFKSMSFI